jgi:hypothetical protein
MIVDYASLQVAVSGWLNKASDANLVARVPEFIQLAEARLKRRLEDGLQETITTITFTDGVASLPADFGGLVEIDGDFQENPIIYDLVGNQIQAEPAISGPATINYFKTITALSNTNATNWLLARAPDIYLYASLIQAEFYGWNDERLPLIKTALDEALGELHLDNERRKWGYTSIAPQIGRS